MSSDQKRVLATVVGLAVAAANQLFHWHLTTKLVLPMAALLVGFVVAEAHAHQTITHKGTQPSASNTKSTGG